MFFFNSLLKNNDVHKTKPLNSIRTGFFANTSMKKHKTEEKNIQPTS